LFLLIILNSITTSNVFASKQSSNDSINALPKINKTFAIVIHVVLNKNGQLGIDTSNLKNDVLSMNAAFKPIGVNFKLVQILTIPNYRYLQAFETFRTEMENQFLLEDRINFFYVDSILEPKGSGLASVGCINSPKTGGIWVQKGANPLVHEMGHYWGLKHTFNGSGNENVDGSNCETAGDFVCDTPADPYIHESPSIMESYVNDDCIFIFEGKDSKGQFYNPNLSNIMSYYSCGGCSTFTHGQYLRMIKTYQINPSKW
jgi:hypothetical protein